MRRAVGIIVEKFFAFARGTSRSDRASLREGSHCRLAAAGAAARAQLHAYPGGGSLRGLPPSVNPSGNNIHTHTAGRTANEWHGKDGNRGWDPQTQPSSLANGDEYRREAAMAVIAGKTRQMVEATNSQVVYWWRQPPEM